MAFTLTTTVSIDSKKLLSKVLQDKGFWTFAAMSWRQLYAPYVPMNTGELYDNVAFAPGEITHLAPYAAAVYSENKNYRRDKHPLAGAYWDKAAAPLLLPRLIDTLQQRIDSGALLLSSD